LRAGIKARGAARRCPFPWPPGEGLFSRLWGCGVLKTAGGTNHQRERRLCPRAESSCKCRQRNKSRPNASRGTSAYPNKTSPVAKRKGQSGKPLGRLGGEYKSNQKKGTRKGRIPWVHRKSVIRKKMWYPLGVAESPPPNDVLGPGLGNHKKEAGRQRTVGR